MCGAHLDGLLTDNAPLAPVELASDAASHLVFWCRAARLDLAEDLASLVARLGLSGRVESGLAKAGIRSLSDFAHVRSEEDFISITRLPDVTGRSLYGAAVGQGRPRAGTLPIISPLSLPDSGPHAVPSLAAASASAVPRPVSPPLAAKVRYMCFGMKKFKKRHGRSSGDNLTMETTMR